MRSKEVECELCKNRYAKCPWCKGRGKLSEIKARQKEEEWLKNWERLMERRRERGELVEKN